MNLTDSISDHFTFKEFFRSVTAKKYGIDNFPYIKEATIKANLQELVLEVLEPLRILFKRPIYVTSGYRCAELNRLIGGSKKSQHLEGKAADITTLDKLGNMVLVILLLCGFRTGELYDFLDEELGDDGMPLKDKLDFLEFDQLILERKTRDVLDYAWLHVSYNRGKNRREVLDCYQGKYRLLDSSDLELRLRMIAEFTRQEYIKRYI